MSFVIPNSNQFSTGVPGAYYTPSDLTVFAPGNDLPSTQSSDIQPDATIVMRLMLRRNPFTTDTKPKGYIKPQRLLDLSYEKQIQFTQSLNQNKLESWYGASDSDIKAVTSYLERHNAQDISINNEQRIVEFVISYENLRQAFMSEQPEMLFNLSDGKSFYYNPNNYADSYLHSSGEGAEAFANAIIGSQIVGTVATNANNKAAAKSSEESGPNYFPSEIADIYNFPGLEESGGGKGVTIGLLGEGGNEYERLNQNGAFNRYLKNQGIRVERLGKLVSPNNSKEGWDESGMDYSIIRSIAPYANLIVSENLGDPGITNTYDQYAQLVYNRKIDLISSSSLDPFSGDVTLKKAYEELFLDATLRGQTIIVSAGDQGTGNYFSQVLPNGRPTPWITSGDSSLLSVGGTAFPKKAETVATPRPNIVNSNEIIPKTYSQRKIDAITGMINQQSTWNSYEYTDEDPVITSDSIYPSAKATFDPEDFASAQYLWGILDNTVTSSSAFRSNDIAMPGYQKKNLEPKWLGTGRRYPDISVLAGNNTQNNAISQYYIFNTNDNGEPILTTGGGTSAGAPLITGLLARITSALRSQFGDKTKLGMINPLLYEKYASKQRGKLFIDIPAGSDNASVISVADSPDEWSGIYTFINSMFVVPINGTGPDGALDQNLSKTGKGFDAATGLGSLNGQSLLDGLTNVWANL